MRYRFLLGVITRYADKTDTILDIGCGQGQAIKLLQENGYNAEGIDKKLGSSIEEVPVKIYDIVYTMSTLFLLKDDEIFKKIAKMVGKYLITIEGEESRPGIGVIGRDYSKIFEPLGFKEVEHQENVFNVFGHLRVFKKI